MAEFKKISDTEVVEAPGENDNLVLISNGEVKQVSAASFAAAAGGSGASEPIRLINNTTFTNFYDDQCTLEDGSQVPRNLYELYLAGTPILLSFQGSWMQCLCTYIDYSYRAFYFISPNGPMNYYQPLES